MIVPTKISAFLVLCIYFLEIGCQDLSRTVIKTDKTKERNVNKNIRISSASGEQLGSSEEDETEKKMQTEPHDHKHCYTSQENSLPIQEENVHKLSEEAKTSPIDPRKMQKEPKGDKYYHTNPSSEEDAENILEDSEVASMYYKEINDFFKKADEQPSLEAIALEDTTIEASDHEYQADIASKGRTEIDNHNSYHYTVSIQRKGAHYASGALVGEKWVLTTAGEFYNVRETIKLFRIRLGSSDCKQGGVVTPIKRITIHPDFTIGKPSVDISLQKLAGNPLALVITPIGISSVKGEVVEAKFLTTYWPRIVLGKQGVMPPTALERLKFRNMRASTQVLIPSETCRRQLAAVNISLDRNSLCLKPVKQHHTPCMPDVGAPVVAVDGLWGITSGWVPPNCSAGAPPPTVFTRVSTFLIRTWIDEQMRL